MAIEKSKTTIKGRKNSREIIALKKEQQRKQGPGFFLTFNTKAYRWVWGMRLASFLCSNIKDCRDEILEVNLGECIFNSAGTFSAPLTVKTGENLL